VKADPRSTGHSCVGGDCRRFGTTLLLPIGPLIGLRALAAELILHYEIDHTQHDGLLYEAEQAIGVEMLDLAREIFRERGIPIPAE